MSGPGANPYLRRPAARPPAPRGGDGLADVLERVLDKGLVIAGDIQINLLDIELLTIKVRLLLASADTAQQMGIDWWKHDPFLSGRDRDLAQENAALRERLARLEAAMGVDDTPPEAVEADRVELQPADDGSRLRVDRDEDGTVEVTALPDLSGRSKAELQGELRTRGLPVSGTKAELIERLRDDG